MVAHVLRLAFGCQPVDSPSLHNPCLFHIVVFPQVLSHELVSHPSSQEQFSHDLCQKTWDEDMGTYSAAEASFLHNMALLLLSIP